MAIGQPLDPAETAVEVAKAVNKLVLDVGEPVVRGDDWLAFESPSAVEMCPKLEGGGGQRRDQVPVAWAARALVEKAENESMKAAAMMSAPNRSRRVHLSR